MYLIQLTGGTKPEYVTGFSNTLATVTTTNKPQKPAILFDRDTAARKWADRYIPGWKYEIVEAPHDQVA